MSDAITGTALSIYPQGDGKLGAHIGHAPVQMATIEAMSALPSGMTSGSPSVAVLVKLPDGSFAIAETSLRLLLTACDAFKAVHGDPRGS